MLILIILQNDFPATKENLKIISSQIKNLTPLGKVDLIKSLADVVNNFHIQRIYEKKISKLDLELNELDWQNKCLALLIDRISVLMKKHNNMLDTN